MKYVVIKSSLFSETNVRSSTNSLLCSEYYPTKKQKKITCFSDFKYGTVRTFPFKTDLYDY